MKKSNLPKKSILKKNKTFTKVFKYGDRFSSQYFMAYVFPADELHVGFASQRGYKHKPQRNRIKRITRELWRKNSLNMNFDMVIVSKLSILKIEHSVLEKDFISLLKDIQQELNRSYCEKNNSTTC